MRQTVAWVWRAKGEGTLEKKVGVHLLAAAVRMAGAKWARIFRRLRSIVHGFVKKVYQTGEPSGHASFGGLDRPPIDAPERCVWRTHGVRPTPWMLHKGAYDMHMVRARSWWVRR